VKRAALTRKALLALRDPLARIALALQELDSARPRELRDRAAAIRDALGDVEGRLGEIERSLLTRERSAQEPNRDCRSALPEIRARASAAIAARSATLRLALGEQRVPGDLAAVRRTATRLLRAACMSVRDGGEIALSLEHTAAGARFGLFVQPALLSQSAAVDELLERFALAEGAELEREPDRAGECLRVQLRLPAVEAP
jgi:hypothetical protein